MLKLAVINSRLEIPHTNNVVQCNTGGLTFKAFNWLGRIRKKIKKLLASYVGALHGTFTWLFRFENGKKTFQIKKRSLGREAGAEVVVFSC